jgi:transposase
VNGTSTPPTNATTEVRSKRELRGSVLEVLRSLLADSAERDAILSIVEQLVALNEKLTIEKAELEKRLEKVLSSSKKNEGVSTSQLLLALGSLGLGASVAPSTTTGEERMQPELLDKADARLREKSGFDDRPRPEDKMTERPPRQPRTKTPLPAHLPRVENVIPVPPEERKCARCGRERRCIGHDVSEVIELRPAELYVRLDKREKLACSTCEIAPVRAPLAEKVVPSGQFGIRLVAQLLVDKYMDGLPLHRQRERLARLGFDVSVSTLCDQVKWSTDLLRPLWRAALDQVIAARVMHVDGTGLAVLDPDAAGGKRLGTLWGYVGVDDDGSTGAYVYASTGKKVGQKPGEMGPQDVLAQRKGFVVADASNVFDESFKRDDLIECGCNMHGRRYWVKALDAGDQRAALPIAAYKKLYEIEAEIRDRDPREKLAVRQQRSRPIFDEIVSWCRARRPYEPPSSKLGLAIQYTLNHHVALGRFLEDGHVPIDNGAVERLHVRAALARKNFLHAGSDAGGERAAIAFTILSSCRLAGVNPIEYLAEVMPMLARPVRIVDLPALLPARWKARRSATAVSTCDASGADGADGADGG